MKANLTDKRFDAQPLGRSTRWDETLLPLKLDDTIVPINKRDRIFAHVSDDEVVELASSFRLLGFWRIDCDTGLMFMSAQSLEIHGLAMRSADQPVSVTEIFKSIHPDDSQAILTAIERVMGGGSGCHCIFRVHRGDLHYRYARLVAQARGEGDRRQIIGTTYEFFDLLPMAELTELRPVPAEQPNTEAAP